MAKIYGKEYTRTEIMKRVGDVSQLADAREGMLTSGKADGVRTIDVKTGSGLEFTILPSRGMDIAWASFCGKAIGYISKTGVVSPEMFEKDGLSFLRNFTAGLITTCGLSAQGAPSVDEGKEYGLHGRISNLRASDVSVYKEWNGDEFEICVRGKVNESEVFSENLTLTRTIKTKMGSKKIQICDKIENLGFEEKPCMFLYHINFGFPVLSEDSRLIHFSQAKVRPRDEEAAKGIDCFDKFDGPTHGYNEQVFFHDLEQEGNETYACIFNDALQFGAYTKFNTNQLKCFTEWKMIGEGEYVVGLEPGNSVPTGRAANREAGTLPMIAPGEVITIDYEIGVVESEDELKDVL